MKKLILSICAGLFISCVALADTSSKSYTISNPAFSGWSDSSGSEWYRGGYWSWVPGIASCNNGNFGFFEFNISDLSEFLDGKTVDSAILTVRTLYHDLNGDLGIYSLTNNDKLTGNVVNDGQNSILPRGLIPDSGSLIDTVEASPESTIPVETDIQFDLTDYIRDLANSADLDKLTYLGFEFYSANATSDTYLYSTGTSYNPELKITVSTVPEPSACAAILGALALGFVVYRRRK